MTIVIEMTQINIALRTVDLKFRRIIEVNDRQRKGAASKPGSPFQHDVLVRYDHRHMATLATAAPLEKVGSG